MENMKQLCTIVLTYFRNGDSGSFLLMFCFSVCLVAGCTTLRPGFETPSVTVTSFKLLPSQSLSPRFEIGIRIVNPNSTELSPRGMSYKVFLNDHEVVEGAANELPVVPAYGEAEFKVIATVGLIEGMQFVNDLLQNASGQVTYRLQSKLDIGAMTPRSGSRKPAASLPKKIWDRLSQRH
jgi:LEA14-like dessication related protein